MDCLDSNIYMEGWSNGMSDWRGARVVARRVASGTKQLKVRPSIA